MPTAVSYNDALNEKSYRAGVTLAAQLQTYKYNFTGADDSNAAIVLLERGGSKRGDTVELRFSDINHSEEPKTRLAAVLGQESGTNRFTDKVQLRYFLFDGAVENATSDQQLVSFSLKKGEIERITRQWAYTWDRGWINQMSGYTVVNTAADYGLSCGNAVVAPHANHHIFAPGSADHSAEAAVAADATAVMTTRLLDEAVMKMTSRLFVKFPAAPCSTPFGDLFLALVGPTGFDQMRQNAATSDFYDIHKAAIQGGNSFLSSPILTGEGFIHQNTLVLKTDFATQGVNGAAARANIRRAVVLGARSSHLIFGEGFTDGDHLGWSEHMQHRRWSCLADTVYGLKKTVVDGEDWSSMVISHYSPV